MLDYKSICNEYKFKTELHAHSKPVSACSEILPEDLVKAYASIGCDTVTITNHLNPNWNVARTREYLAGFYDTQSAAAGTGINVVLAVEIRFPENANDYLVYGVRPEDIENIISLIPYGIENFYKSIKSEDNLILQAHPFRNGMELAPLDFVDGIETLNMHPGHNSRVAVASRYAHDNKLVVSGGTDYHHAHHQGMCLLRTRERMNDSFDIARVLKSRDYLLDMSGTLVIPEQF